MDAHGTAGFGSVTQVAPAPQREATARLPPRLADAVRLLAAGEAHAALAAASEACHAAPHRAEPHYVYGQAWAALGEPACAEQAFAATIQRAPDWSDAWVNYGLARYSQGAVEDAKTAMREALRRAPGHAAAGANLGAFMRITGEHEGAEALLRGAIARDPGDAGARLNLAADLLQEERADDALALLDDAAPPGDAAAARHWHLQRSLALLQLAHPAEARGALQAFDALGPVPPALGPGRHWRDVLLAQAERDRPGAQAAAERMEMSLGRMGSDVVPEHRIMAHYDLAKFHSGLGQHAAAFTHWTAAHRLLARSQPFSRPDHLSFILANAKSFDRRRFVEGPRAANRDPAPVFIVGMPRSGTTLCEQILAAHRDVHGAGERTALGRAFATLGGGRDDPDAVARVAGIDADALDRAADRFLADLHALSPGKGRVVDKMPGNYLYLGLVGLLLPGARVIHCRRDPRDIGLSIFTFRFHGQHGYAHDLGDLGWAIAQQDWIMGHWKTALPNPVLTVDLADWVLDFDGTLARVLGHLDLPTDPNCVRFYEGDTRVRTVSRAQVRQPVNARGLGRWRSYEAELAPLIAELDQAGIVPSPPRH